MFVRVDGALAFVRWCCCLGGFGLELFCGGAAGGFGTGFASGGGCGGGTSARKRFGGLMRRFRGVGRHVEQEMGGCKLSRER